MSDYAFRSRMNTDNVNMLEKGVSQMTNGNVYPLLKDVIVRIDVVGIYKWAIELGSISKLTSVRNVMKFEKLT
jgi:hypothetical protein